ncbi:Cif family virulence factor [Parachitinimonas caeni]|uniref:DUF4440 domain-containing protein n=1 Tax=Parachitinimonas caeni TaxID=3031301 RepID=A0ABT7E2X9_9NEIS|nr:hypothetical protein [Parachitinimonas caeni]MDK2126399.1 hypothetical protein [Parachitinimonas caeni]
MTSTPSDSAQIDQLVQAFFSVFTCKDGQLPDLSRLYALCLPEAVIACHSPQGTTVYSLESFIAPRQALFASGRLTDFQEQEDSADTQITGGIASRHCRYSKAGLMEGQPFTGRGTKYLHFVKMDKGWRISSVVWQDDI